MTSSFPKDISQRHYTFLESIFKKVAYNYLAVFDESKFENGVIDHSKPYKLEALANAFQLRFTKYKEEETFMPEWYYEMDASVNYQNKEWISIEINEHSYTGGVHGNQNTIIRTYSKSNLEVMTFEDLNISESAITKKMEMLFRKKYHIDPNDKISSSGFWFEDNTFQLNNNYAIRNDSLIFLYNPYEISSYAMGFVEIGVPLKQLGEVL